MSQTQTDHLEAGSASHHDAQIKEEDRIRRKRQRQRSLALGWSLAILALLFFIVTLVRLGPMVTNRPL
jgi:hypothetical protein